MSERTVPVRLSDETADSLRFVASAKGTTPGAVMADAWRWWWNRWGDSIVNDLHVTIESMRPRGKRP